MKTVFSNREVADVWAAQSQTYGRSNNGNLFFNSGTLFSYGKHFIVGRYVQNVSGETICLINNRHYSSSTATHQSYARRANTSPTICVSNPNPHNEQDHRANVVDLRNRAEIAFGKAERARVYKDMHLDDAVKLEADALKYCEWFGVKRNDRTGNKSA